MSDAPPLVVLVGGRPGSGKSTLVRALAHELTWPVLAKDVVKESLFDTLGTKDRAWSRRLGAAASEAVWALLAAQPGNVLVEGVFSTSERDFVAAGLARAGREHVAQVVCECPPEVALRRFWSRISSGERHPGHAQSPAQIDAEDELAWNELAKDRFDLQLGPVLRVDTTEPVDAAAIAAWVHQHASGVA